MKLYGSITSPYVRRIRLLLAERTYEFVNLDIFSSEGEAVLNQHNPTRKIPMLADNDQMIFDSGVIYRYLSQKFALPTLSWEQENQLTLINAANDSMVELFLCYRSGMDTSEDKLFFNLQHQRIQRVFSVLEQQAAAGDFKQWDYITISLYCLLDWTLFRERLDLTPYTSLRAFHQAHQQDTLVELTNPRG